MGKVRRHRNTLCPERRHEVRLAPNAVVGFLSLEAAVRERLVEMLCDVAEVATLAPGVVDFGRGTDPLAVRAGSSLVFYSVDASKAVTVQHVVPVEVLPLSA